MREFGRVRLALGLLTTLPVGSPAEWQPGESGRAAHWYPLTGALVGAGVWLALFAGRLVFPPLVAGALALLAWVALTGGLHLDGLADCCDGLFAPVSPVRRLEIMKDPRLGTFGGLGLALVLLLKFTALASLPAAAGLGIPLAAALGRWCILPAGLLPLARPGGMGADFASGLRRGSLLVGALIPLALAALLGLPGLTAALAGLLAAAGAARLAHRRLGGVTGDVFGMLVEATETVTLLALTVAAK